MIDLLAAALLASASPPPCTLQRPADCAAMYELVETPGFKRALRKFVGPDRSTWYDSNRPRAQQLLDIFYGPSSDRDEVGPGLLRFDACYPHVCSIRAVLFITTAGQIRGAALMYPDCAGKCIGTEPFKLTILRDPAHPEIERLGREWADVDIARVNERFESDDRLQRVEILDANVPSRKR